MTTQHQLRITTSRGDKYTSAPHPGTAAECAPAYFQVFSEGNSDTMWSFPTTDGWVAIRLSDITAFHTVDLPEEPEALADCGDEG